MKNSQTILLILLLLIIDNKLLAQASGYEGKLNRIFYNLPITEGSKELVKELLKQKAKHIPVYIPEFNSWIQHYKKSYTSHPDFKSGKSQIHMKVYQSSIKEEVTINGYEVDLRLYYSSKLEASIEYDKLINDLKAWAIILEEQPSEEGDAESELESESFYFDKTSMNPLLTIIRNTTTGKGSKKGEIVIHFADDRIVKE